MSVHLRPEEIEAESFRIIDAEAGEHGWPAASWPVVRRVVHTSADFDYVRTLAMSDDAVSRGMEALRRGARIVTDTTMALAGIRKGDLARFGCEASCFVADPAVAAEAKKLGVTRSIIAMRHAARRGNAGVFVIGNAPTALFELLRIVREEGLRPDLVIGLPVGFVGAVESKEELCSSAPLLRVPFITSRGRKGGSNVAAAVVNALLIQAAAE